MIHLLHVFSSKIFFVGSGNYSASPIIEFEKLQHLRSESFPKKEFWSSYP